MRARGLKQDNPVVRDRWTGVAPRGGAWIETCRSSRQAGKSCVAPRAGAWIETPITVFCHHRPPSRPVRARGLKPLGYTRLFCRCESRPVRARGLKHQTFCALHIQGLSRPVRARGLKPFMRLGIGGRMEVAPRAGAWIETGIKSGKYHEGMSRPVRARGLKLCHSATLQRCIYVAPRAGAWIETSS